MALKILNPGTQPLGQFDGLDTEYLTLKGGEVVTFTTVNVVTGTDLRAKDVDDGYAGTTTKVRPAVTKTLSTGKRPLFLADEGIAGYGTLFGTVIGGVAGQDQTGVVLGPSSALGSGKVTLWDKPGLYAVTLDAADTTASTGLVPGNATITVASPLYATTAGLLTPDVTKSFDKVSATGLVVGHFIEFASNGSLVTTPSSLVAALNSPTSDVSFSQPNRFTQAVFTWEPGSSLYV